MSKRIKETPTSSIALPGYTKIFLDYNEEDISAHGVDEEKFAQDLEQYWECIWRAGYPPFYKDGYSSLLLRVLVDNQMFPSGKYSHYRKWVANEEYCTKLLFLIKDIEIPLSKAAYTKKVSNLQKKYQRKNPTPELFTDFFDQDFSELTDRQQKRLTFTKKILTLQNAQSLSSDETSKGNNEAH